MKSFFASVFIFLLLLSLITWNYLYIHRVCGELQDAATALPEVSEGAAAVEALAARWEREESFIDLSASHRSMDKVKDCLAEWQAALRAGDAAEYERCRALFLAATDEIQRAERFSLSNFI